jgi:hypothetical protein
MAGKPQRADWTQDEVKREEAAERARVRRDAVRGVTKNLENAVAHTELRSSANVGAAGSWRRPPVAILLGKH